MYINGKRTETVGVSEGLDVGEEDGAEVGCKQAAFGYMLGALIWIYFTNTHTWWQTSQQQLTEVVGVKEGLDVGEEDGEEVGYIKNKDVKKIAWEVSIRI